ncbi:MAG: ATP-binding cassette domain-containing protein, partial [Litoreibacter sp.]
MTNTLIRAQGLSVGFTINKGLFGKFILKAVDDVTIHIENGSFFGLVGESGSGKTTLGRALLKAVPITGGSAHYED